MEKLARCSRCLLDTTVDDISFDSEGVCNYCHSYDEVIKTVPTGDAAKDKLQELVQLISKDGKHKEYDCIIGLSGGVDSTYLAHLVISLGLRPLAVHVDTGWNSEIAVQNIENVVSKLDIDLFTYVVDWEEMKDLQLSFFKASLPDCDIPQDHVFPAILNRLAAKKGIKHIISGHNIVTEYVLPRNWSYDSNDLVHLKDVHSKFGSRKLKNYPTYSLFDRTVKYKFFHRIQTHRFLYYVDYNKEDVKSFITSNLGWKDYGGKHFESRFTKFFQAYYLPEKFGFDKRKAHLSNLIVSNQISKQDAIEELEQSQYTDFEIEDDIDYVTNKLGISRGEWDNIMNLEKRSHYDYEVEGSALWFKCYKKATGFIKRLIR